MVLKRILFLLLLSAATSGAADLKVQNETNAAISSELAVGYRFVSTDDNPQRAGEYDYLHSSATVDGTIKGSQARQRFSLDGIYLNEKDYLLEGDYDYRGLFRIHGLSEALYHNLDHQPFAPPDRPDAVRPSQPDTPWVEFEDLNPGEKYYREINQTEVHIRAKLPDYPAHFNLEYWRFTRKGSQQQHFLDEGSGPGAMSCVQCHVRGKTRKLDRVTDQFRVGSNAHFGHVDVSVNYLLRDFREHDDIPQDSFGSNYSMFTSTTYRNPGKYQHDEVPNSRLQSGEIKLHSSLSGGLVAAGNFSIGQRENRSDVSDVSPVRAKSDFYKGGTDLTWQPDPHWTLHLRYRLLDIDNSNSSHITAAGSPQVSDLEVRSSIDLTRDTYEASLVYRPWNALKIRTEAKLVQLHRGNTGPPTTDPLNSAWELPADENIYTAKLDVINRPFDVRLPKLHASYEYQKSDDPAYGSSAENRHTLFTSVKWQFRQQAGMFGNVQYVAAKNDRFQVTESDGINLYPYDLDHRQRQINASAGLWATPGEGNSLSFFYGFFRQKIEQDILFGSGPTSDPSRQVNIVNEDVPYQQRVHSLNLVGTLRLLDNLTARLEGRYVTSKGSFKPDFASYQAPYLGFGPADLTATPEGLDELSEIEMRQYTSRFGLEWKGDNDWTYGAQYALEKYDDRVDDQLDGTVQILLVNLGRRW